MNIWRWCFENAKSECHSKYKIDFKNIKLAKLYKTLFGGKKGRFGIY